MRKQTHCIGEILYNVVPLKGNQYETDIIEEKEIHICRLRIAQGHIT